MHVGSETTLLDMYRLNTDRELFYERLNQIIHMPQSMAEYLA